MHDCTVPSDFSGRLRAVSGDIRSDSISH
eukprot:COSAG02_NODE_53773_length_299_cov_2.205000_1_plen_28_part_10